MYLHLDLTHLGSEGKTEPLLSAKHATADNTFITLEGSAQKGQVVTLMEKPAWPVSLLFAHCQQLCPPPLEHSFALPLSTTSFPTLSSLWPPLFCT